MGILHNKTPRISTGRFKKCIFGVLFTEKSEVPESNRPHGLLVHLTVVPAMIHNFRLESVATINWFIIFRTKRPHPESNRNPGRYPVHLPLMACSAYYTVMCYVIQRFFRIAFSSPSQLRPGSSPMFLCYTKCSAGQCFDFCAYAFLLIGFFFLTRLTPSWAAPTSVRNRRGYCTTAPPADGFASLI